MFEFPQHTTAPVVRSPQVWLTPAVTALNAPVGASREVLEPQQVMVLLVRSPQLCRRLAVTALNAPAGASVCP